MQLVKEIVQDLQTILANLGTQINVNTDATSILNMYYRRDGMVVIRVLSTQGSVVQKRFAFTPQDVAVPLTWTYRATADIPGLNKTIDAGGNVTAYSTKQLHLWELP